MSLRGELNLPFRKSSVSLVRPTEPRLSVRTPIIGLTKRGSVGMQVAGSCKELITLCNSVRKQERLLTQSFRRFATSRNLFLRQIYGLPDGVDFVSREKLAWCLNLWLFNRQQKSQVRAIRQETLNESLALAESSRTNEEKATYI